MYQFDCATETSIQQYFSVCLSGRMWTRSAFESEDSVHCPPQHNVFQTVERWREGRGEEEIASFPSQWPSVRRQVPTPLVQGPCSGFEQELQHCCLVEQQHSSGTVGLLSVQNKQQEKHLSCQFCFYGEPWLHAGWGFYFCSWLKEESRHFS